MPVDRTPTRRLDYKPPDFQIESIELHFELDPALTTVRSRLRFRRAAREGDAPLVLDGRDVELVELRLDGKLLAAGDYRLDAQRLVLAHAPDQGEIEVVTRVSPQANTALEGLYESGALLCTQCEAHGFSRITYFPDRPDVMTRYRVTLLADRGRYPVLLSNGNPVARGEGEGGRHWVTWEDPFPKPCYLFALVAGDLALVEDRFVTRSGRNVALRIYTEPENRGRCGHAMNSLKQAMYWDEETYGREYDLDLFMIVAVGSFNMGAMENKGLNIFNAKYILADPETATDADHEAVRDIIGHEYFHNWTGNRITCRDWFQLSVKESLTVFREQQFSAAMGSPGVARVRQARLIRTLQFPEDAGPTAHPVQPDSYIEVNNLYTLTVYEKGAEVIRMLHTLLGAEKFRRGMDLYFARHDGEAVTVEQFLRAMEEASGRDLAQFRRWYHQTGTPVVGIREECDLDHGTLTVFLDQGAEPPLHVPLRLALLDDAGAPREVCLVEITEPQQVLRFDGVGPEAMISALQGFSAPIQLEQNLDESRLARIARQRGDAFAAWDAAQQLFVRTLLRRLGAPRQEVPALPHELVETLRHLVGHPGTDLALTAEILSLPPESYLADQCDPLDVDAVVASRDTTRRELAVALFEPMLALYQQCRSDESYRFDGTSAGRRRMRAVSLAWLTATGASEAFTIARRQYLDADNMTDALSALIALNDYAVQEREACMSHFHGRWADNPLVLDKWLGLVAVRPDTGVDVIQQLAASSSYDGRNPNRIRALLGSFAHGNMRGFHDVEGRGYQFIAERVEALDSINPQVAARLVTAFKDWRRFTEPRRSLQQRRLKYLSGLPKLSSDVHEIVSKSLGMG